MCVSSAEGVSGRRISVGAAGRWRLESKIKIGQFARDRIE
jgi:hypothetical protein